MKDIAKRILRWVGAYDSVRSRLLGWYVKRKRARAIRREVERRLNPQAFSRSKTRRALSWQDSEAVLARFRAELDKLHLKAPLSNDDQRTIEGLITHIRDIELAMRGIDRNMTIAAHVPVGHAEPEKEFRRLGQVLAQRILSEIQLGDNAAIIDIGCGGGRVATGLSLIAPAGVRYLGFDIRRRDINFARYYLSSRHRDFQFIHLDFYNHRYNRSGTIRSLEDYFFPAPSQSFDLAVATSFFTHVDRAMAERCLAETARVLKPGAQGYLTFFIHTQDYKASSKTKRQFVFEFQPGVWASGSADVLQSVAFDSALLLDMISASGLEIERTLLGAWRGRQSTAVLADGYRLSNPIDADGQQSQDIIIVRRV